MVEGCSNQHGQWYIIVSSSCSYNYTVIMHSLTTSHHYVCHNQYRCNRYDKSGYQLSISISFFYDMSCIYV